MPKSKSLQLCLQNLRNYAVINRHAGENSFANLSRHTLLPGDTLVLQPYHNATSGFRLPCAFGLACGERGSGIPKPPR